MIRRFIDYCRKLTEKRSAESSKRFMALMTMILVYYIVIRFTTAENIEIVLVELLSFILVLCGVAVWENISRKT